MQYASGWVCELTTEVWVGPAGEIRKSSAGLSCDRRFASRNLTSEEARELLRMARDSQLYRARGIGKDARGADMWMATLKVSQADDGQIVILVVSGNPEFSEGPRRQLLQFLTKLYLELMPRLAPLPPR